MLVFGFTCISLMVFFVILMFVLIPVYGVYLGVSMSINTLLCIVIYVISMKDGYETCKRDFKRDKNLIYQSSTCNIYRRNL